MGAWLTGTNFAFAVSKLFPEIGVICSFVPGEIGVIRWHTGACALGCPARMQARKSASAARRMQKKRRGKSALGKERERARMGQPGEEEVEESVTHLDENKSSRRVALADQPAQHLLGARLLS